MLTMTNNIITTSALQLRPIDNNSSPGDDEHPLVTKEMRTWLDQLFTTAQTSMEQTHAPSAPNLRGKPIIISVEGNIGAGKSAASRNLVAALHEKWNVIQEPVEKWQHLLHACYSQDDSSADNNRPLATALLQSSVLSSYANMGSLDTQQVIMERGPWSSLCVFLQAQDLPPNYKQLVYDAARAAQLNLQRAFPSALIYMSTPPEECQRRIQEPDLESKASPLSTYKSLNIFTKQHCTDSPAQKS